MTVAILVFNFYPLTAIMIVMLALLNDGAILSIAYDNVHYRNEPKPGTCAWCSASPPCWGDRADRRVRLVLLATVSSTSPPARPDADVSDAVRRGHLTIFLTRTRGPFWSSARPASW